MHYMAAVPARGGQRLMECHREMGLSDGMMPPMATNVTLDNAGRVVIPKSLRDELGLRPGDVLALESDGERFITLRPVRSGSQMSRVRKDHRSVAVRHPPSPALAIAEPYPYSMGGREGA